MKCDKKSMILYAVTDRTWLLGRTLAHDVEESLKGGATMVQLREKNLGYTDFLDEAFTIKALCKKYKVPFIINDDIEIALACDANGIHVGQDDLDVLKVREQLGDKKIIGVSVRTVEQAKKAVEQGADYLGVGAVFKTTTKLDANFVDYDMVKAICNAVEVPVCGIGGIDENNINHLVGSGLDGVALVSAIFAQENIKEASQRLFRLSMDMVKGE